MSETNEAIIAKIQKVLAMTGSPNENEAAVAAAKVQELLAAHNLSMAEVGAKGQTNASHPSYTPRKQETLDFAAMYQYQRTLAQSIAQNNFCYHFITEREKPDPKSAKGWRTAKTHVLVGAQVNVIAAHLMYGYLIETMDRLLPWQGMAKRGKEALLWLEGCTDRLTVRLAEQRKKQERQSREAAHGTNGLVLSDVYSTEDDLNRDYVGGWPMGTHARWRREAEERRAQFERDRAEGKVAPVAPSAKPETEAQRRKREEKEHRRYERWHEKFRRQQAKIQARRMTDAYQSGAATADSINLDQQVAMERKEVLT